jgi:hypothetical protein
MYSYRIKVIEPNNSHSYSPTIIIKNNNEAEKLLISPNPVQAELYLKIPGSNFVHKELMLVNSAGVIVQKQQLNVTNNQVKLNLGMLPGGVYIIQVTDHRTGRKYTGSFTKAF